MKRYLLLPILMLTLSSGFLMGQLSLTEDFESYAPGDGIAASSPDWVLWPDPPGGDSFVSNQQAVSGSNSLEVAGGTGQDVLLDFGRTFTSGNFSLSMEWYIPDGMRGYFNIQGTAPGSIWSTQTFFEPDGSFIVDREGPVPLFNGSFPIAEWFNIRIDVDLDNNLWRYFINGACLGTFENTVPGNAIASLNLFPADGQSLYFVDDIVATHDTAGGGGGGIALDASVLNLWDPELGAPMTTMYGLTGTSQDVQVQVMNSGSNEINSFSVTTEIAGESATQAFDITIPQGESAAVTLQDVFTHERGSNLGNLTITTVNGLEDDNICNNTATLSFRGVMPVPGKAIWVEEGTSTGCDGCPRGEVYMNYLANKFPESFVGISVHNDDPMVFDEWDGPFSGLISDYPGAAVERDEVALGGIEELADAFASSAEIQPLATMEHGAFYREGSQELVVDVATTFSFALGGNMRIAVGLTEDGVTGTGSDYNQSNGFAGGANGPMGGFEDRPATIAASDIEYNRVARYLATDFGGNTEFENDNISDGETVVKRFIFPVDPSWNLDNMNIVTAFIPTGNGDVDNAVLTTVPDARANNLILSDIDLELDAGISITPNPVSDLAQITISVTEAQDMRMDVFNANGLVLNRRNLGTLSGETTLELDATDYAPGFYYVRVFSGERFTTKRLVITE